MSSSQSSSSASSRPVARSQSWVEWDKGRKEYVRSASFSVDLGSEDGNTANTSKIWKYSLLVGAEILHNRWKAVTETTTLEEQREHWSNNIQGLVKAVTQPAGNVDVQHKSESLSSTATSANQVLFDSSKPRMNDALAKAALKMCQAKIGIDSGAITDASNLDEEEEIVNRLGEKSLMQWAVKYAATEVDSINKTEKELKDGN